MKRIIILLIFLIPAGLLINRHFNDEKQPESIVVSEAVQSLVAPEPVKAEEGRGTETRASLEIEEDIEEEGETEVGIEVIIPADVLIDAPFVVQAPFADWSELYKEACEEASVVVVHHFYQGDTELTQDEMKASIDDILNWGLDTFGSYDTTTAETARYFTEFYDYDESRVSVIYDFTIEDIKAVLAQGYPVIVPAAGRELGNKYFQTPGPLYHMLVIVGYDNDEFITNDPGTRRGEGYRYKQEVLYNAIHDLTEPLENISNGRKAMIVVR